MSAAKHTPGPWVVNKGRDWRSLPHIRTASGLYVMDAPTRGNSGAHAKVRQMADAHLIAAAPELLRACENARDMLATDRQAFVDCQQLRDIRTEDPIAHGLVAVEDGVWIEPGDAEALRDYDRAISMIDAAILKARTA